MPVWPGGGGGLPRPTPLEGPPPSGLRRLLPLRSAPLSRRPPPPFGGAYSRRWDPVAHLSCGRGAAGVPWVASGAAVPDTPAHCRTGGALSVLVCVTYPQPRQSWLSFQAPGPRANQSCIIQSCAGLCCHNQSADRGKAGALYFFKTPAGYQLDLSKTPQQECGYNRLWPCDTKDCGEVWQNERRCGKTNGGGIHQTNARSDGPDLCGSSSTAQKSRVGCILETIIPSTLVQRSTPNGWYNSGTCKKRAWEGNTEEGICAFMVTAEAAAA